MTITCLYCCTACEAVFDAIFVPWQATRLRCFTTKFHHHNCHGCCEVWPCSYLSNAFDDRTVNFAVSCCWCPNPCDTSISGTALLRSELGHTPQHPWKLQRWTRLWSSWVLWLAMAQNSHWKLLHKQCSSIVSMFWRPINAGFWTVTKTYLAQTGNDAMPPILHCKVARPFTTVWCCYGVFL